MSMKQWLTSAAVLAVSAAVGFGGYTAFGLGGRAAAEGGVLGEIVGPAEFTPTPSAPPPAVNPAYQDVAPGDVVAEDPGLLRDGLLPYQVDDHTYLVVDPAAELPTQVVDDLTGDAVSELTSPDVDRSGLALALEGIDGRAVAGTGRHAVVVFPVTGAPAAADEQGQVDGWVFWGRDSEDVSTQSFPMPTVEEATAAARAWADEADIDYVLVTAP